MRNEISREDPLEEIRLATQAMLLSITFKAIEKDHHYRGNPEGNVLFAI
jgi:hypothetical protein